MNAEKKKAWVEALRSGKYVQATGALYKGKDEQGRTCCCALGVLNDISGLGYWLDGAYVVEHEDDFMHDAWHEVVSERLCDGEEDFKSFRKGFDPRFMEYKVAPPDLRAFRGAKYSDNVVNTIQRCFVMEEELLHRRVAEAVGLDRSPMLVFEGEERDLHELNDTGVSFDELADVIEEQL